MCNGAITDWKMFLREICAGHIIKNPAIIRDPGISVEILMNRYFLKENIIEVEFYQIHGFLVVFTGKHMNASRLLFPTVQINSS